MRDHVAIVHEDGDGIVILSCKCGWRHRFQRCRGVQFEVIQEVVQAHYDEYCPTCGQVKPDED